MRKLYFHLAVFIITLIVGLAGTFLRPASDPLNLADNASAGPVEELNLCGERGYEIKIH